MDCVAREYYWLIASGILASLHKLPIRTCISMHGSTVKFFKIIFDDFISWYSSWKNHACEVINQDTRNYDFILLDSHDWSLQDMSCAWKS